ncbi:MAG: ElyC/SanA/YdcF family protein, partial [Acetobacteraceae bacterium]
VSGIGGGARLADLGRRAGVDPRPLAPRVTLGRGAATTFGNAEEAAAWVRAEHVRSLILVTAFYHMPRAEAEFRRALPGVHLVPWPVRPPGMRRLDGLASWTGLRLMGDEYIKFLAAELGLTALAPGPPPRLIPARVEGGRAPGVAPSPRAAPSSVTNRSPVTSRSPVASPSPAVGQSLVPRPFPVADPSPAASPSAVTTSSPVASPSSAVAPSPVATTPPGQE